MITIHKDVSQDSKFQPIKLLPHQKHLLEHLSVDKFPIYICWSMGSGKTIGACMCMSILPIRSRALIICDKSTVTQWKLEAEKILHRNHLWFQDITVDIIHYEFLDREESPIPKMYAMVIVDESHRFRNAWSKESQRMMHWMRMIHECSKVIFLSGTPIVHDAQTEFKAFRIMMKHPDLHGRVFFYDPRTDQTSKSKYPSVVEMQVPCEMSWAQCFVYMQNKKQKFTLHLNGESEPRVRMSSSKNTYNTLLRSICNNPFPDNPALSPKFQTILDKMEAYNNKDKKQIVYSCRKDTGVRALQSLWNGLNDQVSFQITGDMSQEDRADNIAKFNRKPKSVLFITDAGGQGIDLKRVDVVHIMEPAENVQDERQIMNRAVRYKSHTQPSESIVYVLRYVSVFPEKGIVAPPWKHVIYESGLFDKAEMKGISRSIQYALKKLIKEDDHMTVDQKVIYTRTSREIEIEKVMCALRTYHPKCS